MYSWISSSCRAGETEEEENRDPAAVAAALAKLDQFYEAIEHLRRDIEDGYRGYCPLKVQYWQAWGGEKTKDVSELPIGAYVAVEQLFNDGIKLWEEIETCQRLKVTMLDANLPCEITKVIGFACGDMSFTDISLDSAQRPASQHALLLTMQIMLQERNKTNANRVLCYVQDPVYTAIDKSVLENLDIEVVDGPEGFLQVIADLARSVILVWSPPVVFDHMVAWSGYSAIFSNHFDGLPVFLLVHIDKDKRRVAKLKFCTLRKEILSKFHEDFG
ncbi:Pc21g08290 [Talaromyces islandicus]|uniref:Pc21g08290 n=1 Tax=Talaromyces islandicus TaxID=28573 RepID=A0A0U1MBH4_TALIS|nr:Pc21g08290 [Talaromyces islandicus]